MRWAFCFIGGAGLVSACGGSVIVNGAASTTAGSSSDGSGTSGAGGSGASGGGGSSSTGGHGGAAQTGCRTTSDCDGPGGESVDICVAPGASAGCGICVMPPMTCQSDADCASVGPTSICTQPECVCGAMTCAPGCTSDAQCATGETCAADHHCVATICGSATDCPANFDCTAGACARRPCDSDSSCTGFCVESFCYDTLGTCVTPSV